MNSSTTVPRDDGRDPRRRGVVPAALCGIILWAAIARPVAANDKLQPGAAMPAFSLPRADGGAGEYGLAQLRGAPAVVVFWRLNQPMSADALRDLTAVANELGADKLRIAAVEASRATAEQIQAALAPDKPAFPVLCDPLRQLYGEVGVIVCPTTLLLDAQGVLRFTVAGRPPQYSQVVRARLRFLLSDTDEAQMNKEIEPTILRIDHEVAAGWRMYNLGVRLQAEGKAAEAAAVFEKAVAEHPTLTDARCALGFIKLAAGELDVAGRHFQAALVHDPAAPSARLGQAAVLARTGQPAQAEQILLSLLGHNSIAVRVRYELGRIYRARGELDKADTFFEDALATMFPEPRAEGTPRPAAVVASTNAPPSPIAPAAAGRSPSSAATPDSPSSPPSLEPKSAPKVTNHPIQAVVFPEDAEIVGVKQCKKCHFQQWKSWKDTRMAQALELLKPGIRPDVKTARRLDPTKDYSSDANCLACHTNGFGIPGGYRLPAPGDAAAAAAAQDNAGVGCESCHGPGNKYVAIHKDIQDKQRKYTQAELHQAGQFKSDAEACARCHDPGGAPCIDSAAVFDYESRKNQGTHRHFDLKFRSP